MPLPSWSCCKLCDVLVCVVLLAWPCHRNSPFAEFLNHCPPYGVKPLHLHCAALVMALALLHYVLLQLGDAATARTVPTASRPSGNKSFPQAWLLYLALLYHVIAAIWL